jgi:hypothetical protein
MNIGRKILILVIIVLFSYIIYSLMQHRRSIISSIQEYKNKKIQIEGFGENDDPNKDAIAADIKSISNKILVQTDNDNKPIIYKNYDSSNDTMKIKDMFMKASYNSAFTGRYLSSEMVKFSLSQGCRFLDFEVDHSNSIIVVTCKNKDGTNKTVSGATNPAFLEVLKCTIDAAFNPNSGTKYPITNRTDPLFINIRCSQSTYDMKVYPLVLQKLMSDDYYKSYLDISNNSYFTDYNSNTSVQLPNKEINTLKNKAVILFCSTDDKSGTSQSTHSNYKYNISDAKTYANISPISSATNNTFTMVLSDPTYLDQIIQNPDVFTSVKNWGYNTTCISYYNYLKNAYLTQNERKYENIFTNFNYSFIKMDSLKSYITTNPLYIKP